MTTVDCNPDAKRLYVDLLVNSSYNKLIRPVAKVKDTLTVKLGLRLSQLIGVVSLPSVFLIQCVDIRDHRPFLICVKPEVVCPSGSRP